jgi:DNA-binding transcriptional ArsR family regulator
MFRESLTIFGRGDDLRVELDRKSLFALASDTRLDILRALQPMRRTVTQLSESLGIDKAAVHRHLKTLEGGGLVKRYEEHGFVYYGLSWKARDLVSPNEHTRIVVLLSASLVIAVCALFFTLIALSALNSNGIFGSREAQNPPYDQAQADYHTSRSISENLVFSAPATILMVISAVLLVAGAVTLARKPRQKMHGPGAAEDKA